MNMSYEIPSTKTLPTRNRSFVRVLRIIGSVLIFLWGWYMCLSFRTTQFGEDGRSLQWYFVCSLVWIFLPSIILFLESNLKKTVRRALILTGVTLLMVIVWANVEEALMVSRLASGCEAGRSADCSTQEWVTFERGWPFQNHTLSYRADDGWHGND